jgi:hypothetical protein
MDRQTKIAVVVAIIAIALILALAVFGYMSGAWELNDT